MSPENTFIVTVVSLVAITCLAIANWQAAVIVLLVLLVAGQKR